MSRDLDVLRTEGGPRLLVELLGVIVVLAAVDYLVVVPVLQTAAPDVFVGSVDYGRWDFPDTPLEYAHMGFLLVTFGSFLYWRLYWTELGQQFAEAYRETRS